MADSRKSNKIHKIDETGIYWNVIHFFLIRKKLITSILALDLMTRCDIGKLYRRGFFPFSTNDKSVEGSYKKWNVNIFFELATDGLPFKKCSCIICRNKMATRFILWYHGLQYRTLIFYYGNQENSIWMLWRW